MKKQANANFNPPPASDVAGMWGWNTTPHRRRWLLQLYITSQAQSTPI